MIHVLAIFLPPVYFLVKGVDSFRVFIGGIGVLNFPLVLALSHSADSHPAVRVRVLGSVGHPQQYVARQTERG